MERDAGAALKGTRFEAGKRAVQSRNYKPTMLRKTPLGKRTDAKIMAHPVSRQRRAQLRSSALGLCAYCRTAAFRGRGYCLYHWVRRSLGVGEAMPPLVGSKNTPQNRWIRDYVASWSAAQIETARHTDPKSEGLVQHKLETALTYVLESRGYLQNGRTIHSYVPKKYLRRTAALVYKWAKEEFEL